MRDASGPNGGLTGNLDGFARLWATSDNEVDISDREGLIRRAKELSTSGIISLKENECQALRRLTIPIFPVPLRVLSENHIWTLCAMTSDVRRHMKPSRKAPKRNPHRLRPCDCALCIPRHRHPVLSHAEIGHRRYRTGCSSTG
jgi:hypothetical protein